MSAKSKLCYSLKNILHKDNFGSFASQHDRQQILLKFISDLVELGYKLPHIENLRQKHIEAVVSHWKQQNLNNSTLKNRLSPVRHLASLINKPQIVLSNSALGIGARKYIPTRNRALHNPDFSKVTNPYIKVSLELQRVFGLRREESLKIRPHVADKGNMLELLPTWCEGGRGRNVPIRTEEQRYWLEQAKAIAEKFGNSLIPPDKNYIKHRYVYDKQVTRAGLRNLHGLRHAYAQQRYKELTGWEAPINGGPKSSEFSIHQKEIDHRARTILTAELGHGRLQIVKNYCGK